MSMHGLDLLVMRTVNSIAKSSLKLGSLLIASLVAAGMTSAPAHAATVCQRMGTAVKISGVSVPTCAALYKSVPGIRVGKDSRTVKYGTVASFGKSTFIDRTGKSFSIPPKLVPSNPKVGVGGAKSLSQVLYAATLKYGKVSALKPVLFVPARAVVNPYRGLMFVGDVSNLRPAESIPDSDWVRWDFNPASNTDGSLSGTFSNLNQSIRRSSILEPPAPCQSALNSGSLRTDWYSQVLGTDAGIKLSWDPAMHGPGDSELVVSIGNVSYMTHSPTLTELLSASIRPSASVTFSIHGNPMGTPADFAGSFQVPTAIRVCTV